MIKRERKIDKLERLNIVPIMDAIFIFIFFLLFSAQFIKLFEIETGAPVVSEVPENVKLDKDPLNLIVKVYKRKIVVSTGIDQKIQATYYKKDLGYKIKMKNKLLKLRRGHPKDDYAIIAPLPTIDFNEIVQVIDTIQTLPTKKVYKIKVNGKEVILKKIFTQVVLEPMDEL